MKFQVTYVHVTRLTRRRAGKSQTVVVDTNSSSIAFAAVNVCDKDRQPLAVEEIFQSLNTSDRSEVKVIDVREVVDVTEEDRRAFAKAAAALRRLDQNVGPTWMFSVSVRMMSNAGGLSAEQREKWQAISARERQQILSTVR